MKTRPDARIPLHRALGAALVCAVLLSGCIDTQVKVQVQADGSGTRRVEMVWEQGTLDELGMEENDVRDLFDLMPDRGWTMRREDRPVRDGSLEPHVIFEREVRMASIDDWPRNGSDLRMRVGRCCPSSMVNSCAVEVGKGSGYRTVTYRERLDGRAIRRLLDRTAANHLADAIETRVPGLTETQSAELRGLLLGYVAHYDIWTAEDEKIDTEWKRFIDQIAPHISHVIDGPPPVVENTVDARALLLEISGQEDINERLEEDLPGLALLVFMNLKVEVVAPGTIVESNADRTGEGFAAWERSAWTAIDDPLEFTVQTRIRD